MVESEVFFEPYHRVLKVLQESRIDDLPMKKYIVDVQVCRCLYAMLISLLQIRGYEYVRLLRFHAVSTLPMIMKRNIAHML